MIVECLIKRDGATPVELGKTKYMFMPYRRPGVKEEAPGYPVTSICEINAEEHLEFLLKSKQFRPFVEGQETPKEKILDMHGYSIVKHQDGRAEGYRIENKKVTPRLYAGSDGVWKPNTQGLIPFDTEFSAWMWLQEEVAAEDEGSSPASEETPDLTALAGSGKKRK